MIVELHAACSLLCDVCWLPLLLLDLCSCRRPGVRACVRDESCACVQRVVGVRGWLLLCLKSAVRCCVVLCREMWCAAPCRGVRAWRFRWRALSAPRGWRSRVREHVRSAVCRGRAHLRGAPSRERGPHSFHMGGGVFQSPIIIQSSHVSAAELIKYEKIF